MNSSESGLVIRLLPWSPAFFVLHDSHFAVQCGCIKKSGNAVSFLNVAPVPLHCKNHEQLCGGVNIGESNIGFWRVLTV